MTTDARQSHNRRPRPGFTLLEMLVVLFVMAILLGITVVALKSVGGGAKAKSTQATLASLRQALSELEAQSRLDTRQPRFVYINPAAPAVGGPYYDLAIEADPQVFNLWRWYGLYNKTAKGAQPELKFVAFGGKAGDVGLDTVGRFDIAAVRNTQLALSLMRALPSNAAALDALPGQSVTTIKQDPGVTASPYKFDTSGTPLVLDAFGGPVILVPGSGVEVLDSTKTTGATRVIRAPDGRPFFMSAGPDGNFRTHDDNVYSFEN